MAKIDGRFIRLEFGAGTFLKGVTTSNVSLSADMIDATNYESNGSKDYSAGEKGGTISATFLFDPDVSSANFGDIFDAWEGGTSTAYVYGHASTGSEVLTGSCLVSTLDWDGPKNEVSTCTATLQITGAIVRDVAS